MFTISHPTSGVHGRKGARDTPAAGVRQQVREQGTAHSLRLHPVWKSLTAQPAETNMPETSFPLPAKKSPFCPPSLVLPLCMTNPAAADCSQKFPGRPATGKGRSKPTAQTAPGLAGAQNPRQQSTLETWGARWGALPRSSEKLGSQAGELKEKGLYRRRGQRPREVPCRGAGQPGMGPCKAYVDGQRWGRRRGGLRDGV